MMKIYNAVYKFFDKLEDRVRRRLTHYPLIYAFIGSVGIVSIWRGVWVISDDCGLSGLESLVIGIVLSMIIGLFVSFFIGDNIIISGLNKEKKIDEKTEEEIQKEEHILSGLKKDIEEIKEMLRNK